MRRRQRLHAVEDEGELHIHRLLDPERAVIVEGRDALIDRHEVGPALRRDARDKVEDRSLGRPLVPGWQRVALRLRRRRPSNGARQRAREASPATKAGRGGRA